MTIGGRDRSRGTEMPETISVSTFPRIHMTLIDLAGATQRRFGGAGFSLNTMPATVSARTALRNTLEVKPDLAERDQKDLERYVGMLSRAMNVCFHVEVRSVMPQHVGLGSKTALMLATGLVCNAVAGYPLVHHDLVSMCGRGGASGIGINTAFLGGFVVDGGHRTDGDTRFRPSSSIKPTSVPPSSVRLQFPTDWRIHLFLPKGRLYHGHEEVSFFEHNTPILPCEVYLVMAAVYHGIVPAIAEDDLGALSVSMREIHRTGFKRREVNSQSNVVRTLVEFLHRDSTIAAGMSSLGPLVYAITSSKHSVPFRPKVVEALSPSIDYLGCVKCRNAGYRIFTES